LRICAISLSRRLKTKTDALDHTTEKHRESVTDPMCNVTRFEYDGGTQRVLKRIDPLGKEETYDYDAAGNLTKVTDRLGRARRFEFDANDRLAKETWISKNGQVVKTIEMEYDAMGNLLNASDDVASFAFAYDNRNRVDRIDTQYTIDLSNPRAFSLAYGYDAAGRVTSVTDGSGVNVTSAYDAQSLLKSLKWQGGGIAPASVRFNHNALGDVTDILRYTDADFANLAVSTAMGFEKALEDNGYRAQTMNAGENSDYRESVNAAYKETEAFGPLQVEPDMPQLMQEGTKPLSRTTQVTHKKSVSVMPSTLLTSDQNFLFLRNSARP
jgi:YD repeat-containing protein